MKTEEARIREKELLDDGGASQEAAEPNPLAGSGDSGTSQRAQHQRV